MRSGASPSRGYEAARWRDVFEHHLEPLGVPIVHNLPLGHGDHLCTVPLGVAATIDAEARTLAIEEAALELTPARSRRDPARVASR